MLQSKVQPQQGEGVQGGRPCRFQQVGQERPHCQGGLKAERKGESSRQREQQVRFPGDRSTPLLEFPLAWFTVAATARFPNLSGTRVPASVTIGALFHSQDPNGDEVTLTPLAEPYHSVSFPLFPLSTIPILC